MTAAIEAKGPRKPATNRSSAIDGPRPGLVTVSSVLFLMYGVVGAVFGSFMVLTSIQAVVASGIPSIWIPANWSCPQTCGGTAIGLPWGGFLVLGLLVLGMGAVGLACGLWLWRGRVRGAIVGLQLTASGFVLAVSIAAAIRLQFAMGFVWPPSNAQFIFGAIATMNVVMSPFAGPSASGDALTFKK